jgi:acyl-CoA thioester hydrolase
MTQPPDSEWFNFPIRVQPQHTDYSGAVWHGTYLVWMEAARVECLRSVGIGFEDLVSAGINLPVVCMSMRYHQAIALGDQVVVMTRLNKQKRLRLNWDYEIRHNDFLCVSAQISLVGVDMQKGKILRTFPSFLAEAIDRIIHAKFDHLS